MRTPKDVREEHYRLGEAKVEAKSRADFAEMSRKEVRAELIVRAVKQDGMAKGVAEEWALTQPVYVAAAEEAIKADREAGLARAQYDAFEIGFEMYRSEKAMERVRLEVERAST